MSFRCQRVSSALSHTRPRTTEKRFLTCFPQNHTFDGMIDQDAVHGQLSPFVHKWLIFRAVQAGVPASYNEAFIALQPSDFQ